MFAPITQGGEGFFPSIARLMTEPRFVTVTQDHSVIPFPEFISGKTVHDFNQSVLGISRHLLARFRTESGHTPENPEWNLFLKLPGKGTAQESSQHEVLPVSAIDGISV